MSPALNKVLETAFQRSGEAQGRVRLDRAPLLGLAASGGETATLLSSLGATSDRIYKALAEVRGSQRVTDQNPKINIRRSKSTGEISRKLARDRQARPGRRR